MAKQFSQKVDWLWHRHIPAGMPVVLAAREGIGKTTIALQIAKEILEEHPNVFVYWFATEGTAADTYIKARALGLPEDGRFMIAQKANGDFVFNFRVYKERELMGELLRTAPGSVAAVFIDSIRGMSASNPNDEETGHTMRHINSIVCDRHKSALAYLHHFSKKKDCSWIDQCTGTTAIPAAVRLVLAILPNSKFSRKIVVAKSNIAEEIPELNVVKTGDEIEIYPVAEDVDETDAARGEQMLLDLFKERGSILARDIYRAGEAQGVSEDVLKRVKGKLGIKVKKLGDGWYWLR
jgi:hypothetical protein